MQGGQRIERVDDRAHPVAQQACKIFRRQKSNRMVVQETQQLPLTERFYAHPLKPMLDICVSDVNCLSHHLNLVSIDVTKRNNGGLRKQALLAILRLKARAPVSL